jgi:GT2 family glycosyltransferase
LTPHADSEQAPQLRACAVVVSHDRPDLLRRCLESVEKSEGRESLQVVVIDNGSRQGIAEMEPDFPNIRFIRLPRNFGLTKALNLGWRASNAPYVLFLHDDVELEPRAAMLLADALDANQDAAAACPLLVDAQGNPAPQLGFWPPDGDFRPAEVSGEDPFPVQYARGAALMVRVFFVKALREIDERYGQFGADADLSAQFRRAGKKLLLIPAARALHHGRTSYSSAEKADLRIAGAVFVAKYKGFAAGLKARIGAAFGALARFELGVFQRVLGGHKIDGE